jgi:thiol-disulfide isomerase/thioredoxin
MVDDLESPSDPAPAPAPAVGAGPSAGARRRALDGRTLTIIVLVALAGAALAGYLTYLVLQPEDEATSEADQVALTLEAQGDVNVDRLLGMGLTTPEGDQTTLDALVDGRRAVVNFWQSTCAPCIEEMPLLEELSQADPELAVIGIATQDPVEQAQRFADQTAITYPWALDPEGLLFYEAKGAGMPTTLLLDETGQVLDTHTGAFASLDDLQAFAEGGS